MMYLEDPSKCGLYWQNMLVLCNVDLCLDTGKFIV